MKTKKIISLILSEGIFAAAFSGCEADAGNSSNNSEVEYVLKVGEAQGAVCQAPLQIVMENGCLDDEGIKWEPLISAAEIFRRLSVRELSTADSVLLTEFPTAMT
ncbi:MAG: hypothetical protein K2K34_02665 [Oscillospiraceae bacterium]|nr:hypothetical protein [Oscillospiraceae bacterium]